MKDDQDNLENPEEPEAQEPQEELEPQTEPELREELEPPETPVPKSVSARPQTGRVNYVWVLAGGYLLYTAYKLFARLFSGQADNWLVNVGGGLLFLAAGCFLMLREWRAYQYGKAHKDDPKSWSDSEDEEDKP